MVITKLLTNLVFPAEQDRGQGRPCPNDKIYINQLFKINFAALTYYLVLLDLEESISIYIS